MYSELTTERSMSIIKHLIIAIDLFFFFFNDPPPPEISPFPQPAALPIYTPLVTHAVLDGNVDTPPANDVCPRPPNPATGDKGCGNKDKATDQLGADVKTDVFVK